MFLMFLCVVLVACAAPIPTPPTVTPESSFDLAGTRWELVSLTLDGVTQTPNKAALPTLDWHPNGEIGGTGGCNSFGGSYAAMGEMLVIKEIRQTVMACAPDEIMTLEAAYMSALASARMFEKRDNQLSITFAEGRGKLLLEPRR